MKARDIIVLFAMLLAWIPVHSQIQFTGNPPSTALTRKSITSITNQAFSPAYRQADYALFFLPSSDMF